jgi:hypothetical protein
MLPSLQSLRTRCPAWLKRLDPGAIAAGPGPWLDRIVEGALVYPGAGLDGSPVRQCLGAVHSFIFLDYGLTPEAVKVEMTKPRATGTGFAHHRLLGMAEFDPAPLMKAVPEEFMSRNPDWFRSAPPFGLWAVYEGTGPHAGERFSFLYLSVEAVQALASLFPRKAPRSLVIQEHGFGGNCWQSFTEPIQRLSESWDGPPELLVVQEGREDGYRFVRPQDGPFMQDPVRSLGTDVATESMHQNTREFLHLQQGREHALEPAGQFGPRRTRTHWMARRRLSL